MVVVGGRVDGDDVAGSDPVAIVVGAAVVVAIVDDTAVVEGETCGNAVDDVGARVTRLLTPACSGAGRSLLQPPTLPTAAVASMTDAAVATSQAATDTIFRLMGT